MEHHFHFKRGDFELSFKGDRDFVEKMIAVHLPGLMGETPPRVSLEVKAEPEFPRVSPSFKPRRNISLADLTELKGASAPTDLVVVAGYYLEKYMQQETYGAAELQAQLATLPAWDCQVVDEVLPVTILQGYMEQLRDERYTLTYKGQTYVRDGLA